MEIEVKTNGWLTSGCVFVEVFRVRKAGQPQDTVDDFVKVSPLALSMQGPNILQNDHRSCESMGSPLYRTPTGGRGPKLLWLLWAEFSSVELLPALALADPVRLRTFGRDLGG